MVTRWIQLAAVGNGGGETVGRDQSRTVIVENVKSFDGILLYTKYNAIPDYGIYLVYVMTAWVMENGRSLSPYIFSSLGRLPQSHHTYPKRPILLRVNVCV